MERDRLELTTPEGLTLDLELAGIGSRALAGVLDLFIQGVLLFVATLALGFGGAGIASAGDETALVLVLTLFIGTYVAILVGYHVAFEVWGRGRTPGKRVFGVRVVRTDGGPLRLSHSLIRTFLRLIDYLPSLYGIGVIAVFASSKNQRLGDLAAGTVVIMDRSRRSIPESISSLDVPARYPAWSAPPALSGEPVSGWDVSRVTDEETALIRRFLERRWSVESQARIGIATELAGRVRPKVVAPAAPMSNEDFLARVAELKSSGS